MKPALRALLDHIVDYAGAFPPASLPAREAFRKYEEYRCGAHAWMLGQFVVTANDLDLLLPEASGSFAVLSQQDHARAASIESKTFVRTKKPFYWETDDLEAVERAGVFAKFRTGGVTPESIPDVDTVATFLELAVRYRVPCKLTAGLHAAVRSERALTCETHAPRAMMHGFVNVFLAAAFAWFGASNLRGVLAETDPEAFHFDGQAHWRDHALTTEQIAAARRDFIHSFGSCSFLEPVDSLSALGWL